MMEKLHAVISRDKSDTLLLLSACAAVLLPHALHVSAWVSLAWALLLLWRGWITWSGRRLPSVKILLPVSALMMAGVFYSFKTFFGREAGVTMLVLLLACKLMEMHARRDLFVVLFLGYFLLLTSFFYQQSLLAAAYVLFCMGLLVSAQLSFHFTGLRPPLRQRLRQGFTLTGLAIPLTLCAFILFPRIQGPLWGLPGDANSARTGMSDSMSPGGISQLAQSDDIAFRVRFPARIPAQTALYWRGIVLSRFDGKTWSAGPAAILPQHPEPVARGPAIVQEIILEPQAKIWMFGLDVPVSVKAETPQSAYLSAQMEPRSQEALYQRIRYQVTSYSSYILPASGDPLEQQEALLIPANSNQRAAALAANWRFHYKSDRQIIERALRFFHEENFSYTLEPPLLGANPVDDFLFQSRAGFCEHYASAFAFLMRAAGIPARVVTGYQGGSVNPVDSYFEVRQLDAHAWDEVWLPEEGWVRVDPTAAVAPERIQRSLQQALPQRGFSGLVNGALAKNGWLHGLRQNWDALNNRWNVWVLNYNRDGQRTLLSKLGLGTPDWQQMSFLFIGVASAMAGLTALLILLRRPSLSPLDKIYWSFCNSMARRGIARLSHEGPQAYLKRLKHGLPAELAKSADAFLKAYTATRYGPPANIPERQQIQVLKALARQCR